MIEGFGERLAKLRAAKGVGLSDMGKQVGISSSMISRYEVGERLPSFKVLIKLAAYFNVTTDYLLGVETASSPIKTSITVDVSRLTSKQIEAVGLIVGQCEEINGAGE